MADELKLNEEHGAGDSLTAAVDYEGAISIEVDEPWAGDTVSGIGRSAAVRLTKEQAVELAHWLLRNAGVQEAFTPSDAQLLGLLDGSGLSPTRPVNQQTDLLVSWVRRCMAAWPRGVTVVQPTSFYCASEGMCDVTPRCTVQCAACKDKS